MFLLLPPCPPPHFLFFTEHTCIVGGMMMSMDPLPQPYAEAMRRNTRGCDWGERTDGMVQQQQQQGKRRDVRQRSQHTTTARTAATVMIVSTKRRMNNSSCWSSCHRRLIGGTSSAWINIHSLCDHLLLTGCLASRSLQRTRNRFVGEIQVAPSRITTTKQQ